MKRTLTEAARRVTSRLVGKPVPQSVKDEFAKKLKAWRERQKLSQSQAAKKLNININTLQNWEIARTAPPESTRNLLLMVMGGK